MSIFTRPTQPRHHGRVATRRAPDSSAAAGQVWAVARITLGWTFLWAFLDKMFGLGFATPSEGAWISGGHPTKGFLQGASSGPFESFYRSVAGAGWADWLFMTGLAGIGLALIAGVGVRVAAAAGALLLTMMWTVALPPENNPLIDDHLLLALLLVGLALVNAGDVFGLGRWWSKTAVVTRWPFLR